MAVEGEAAASATEGDGRVEGRREVKEDSWDGATVNSKN